MVVVTPSSNFRRLVPSPCVDLSILLPPRDECGCRIAINIKLSTQARGGRQAPLTRANRRLRHPSRAPIRKTGLKSTRPTPPTPRR
jgi:hypothetical protein